MTDQAVETTTRYAGQLVATFARGGAGEDPQTVARKLRNVALFAGTDDMLPVLASVKIAADGDRLTMEATDRWGLGEETVTLTESVLAPFSILVNAKALVAAVKATVPARGSFLILRHETGRATPAALILDNGEGSTVRLPAVSGDFPRTASLWPGIGDGSVAAYGLAVWQLARLGKVTDGEKLTPARFTFQPGREGSGEDGRNRPCVVHIGETFRALVMPVRLSS